jgi:hypothetical protein
LNELEKADESTADRGRYYTAKPPADDPTKAWQHGDGTRAAA